MELTVANIIWGVVLPLVIPAGLWTLWAVAKAKGLIGVTRVLSAIAPAVAFGLAFWAVEPIPEPLRFPPGDAVHYLFWAGAAVLVAALIEAVLRPERNVVKAALWLPAIALLIAPLTTSWRNYPGNEPDTLLRSPSFAWSCVAGWTMAVFLMRVASGRLGCAAPVTGAFILGVSAALSAAVIEMSGSHLVGTFRMASLGLSLLPLFVLLLVWRMGRELPAPTLTVFTVLYAGLILASALFYSLTPLNASLLALGPVLPALVPGSRRKTGATLGRLALALAPLVLAFVLALIPFVKSLREQGLIE